MAIYQGFCGSSNPSQSVIADGERTVNWYPERVESAAAPTGMALYPTPGFSTLLTVSQINTRAFWSMGTRAFAVIGTGLYEIYDSWTSTLRGTVAMNSDPAQIFYNGPNGNQLMIVSGGNVYCYNLTTNALTTELTGGWSMGGAINTRFLAFNRTTGQFRMSALNDGTTWDATLFFYRSQGTDPAQAMIVVPPDVWIIGEQTGEVWYDSGAYPQPFAPIPGASFYFGTAAPFSVCKAGSVIAWMTRIGEGQGQIVAARGYVPQVISTYAVDTQIGAIMRSSTITDAEALVYEQEGHLFAAWSFPIANQTWVYDFTMGAWHERGTWNSPAVRYDVWGPHVHGFAFGKHLVGDRHTGNLYAMDLHYGSDIGGSVLRRMRIGPPLWCESPYRQMQIDRFEVIAETGLGLVAGQGSDPQGMLRTSRDGKTWSSERMATAGKLGEYRRKLFWTRLGSSDKLWMPEFVVTDPIPWRLSGADIQGSGFAQVART